MLQGIKGIFGADHVHTVFLFIINLCTIVRDRERHVITQTIHTKCASIQIIGKTLIRLLIDLTIGTDSKEAFLPNILVKRRIRKYFLENDDVMSSGTMFF